MVLLPRITVTGHCYLKATMAIHLQTIFCSSIGYHIACSHASCTDDIIVDMLCLERLAAHCCSFATNFCVICFKKCHCKMKCNITSDGMTKSQAQYLTEQHRRPSSIWLSWMNNWHYRISNVQMFAGLQEIAAASQITTSLLQIRLYKTILTYTCHRVSNRYKYNSQKCV